MVWQTKEPDLPLVLNLTAPCLCHPAIYNVLHAPTQYPWHQDMSSRGVGSIILDSQKNKEQSHALLDGALLMLKPEDCQVCVA
jgi:hypothetical protein